MNEHIFLAALVVMMIFGLGLVGLKISAVIGG